MSDDGEGEDRLEFEVELDAPPERVWRAVTVPAFRERWLPGDALADGEPLVAVAGRIVSYRMRSGDCDDGLVTFEALPNRTGGTRLRIIHDRTMVVPHPANGNNVMMLAA